ncbi:lipid-binding protein [Plebeiibacterium sediminum]|uniref:Lipocalin-like domain-containing protein n=1 Tax=Plebeiibacterium sediminum TaxID=2992112 RepID=A0AAE3MA61_9BACT|nr:lipid-binding protein [Plebeiobacterium sediminum]MCW3789807.1 hypothetical protein [Plebeiobacterium sediminum]
MKRLVIIFMFIVSLVSCTEDAEVWNSSTVDLAGQWWIQTYDTNGQLVEDYGNVLTYNTAADDGSMWVNLSNLGSFGQITEVSTQDLTFAGEDVYVISGGKVLFDVAKSKTGIVTDSIFMTVEKDGIDYVLRGHKKTGFPEDEY